MKALQMSIRNTETKSADPWPAPPKGVWRILSFSADRMNQVQPVANFRLAYAELQISWLRFVSPRPESIKVLSTGCKKTCCKPRSMSAETPVLLGAFWAYFR